jgi:G3E family GTPase
MCKLSLAGHKFKSHSLPFQKESDMKLVLIGGFLGSGKTTAIVNAARILIREGKKVAIITNDQGDQHVDSAYVRSLDIPVREVPNGCFCCNYQQLDEHIEEFKKNTPDIIFAESVGTCTDLIATIARPMSKFKPETEIVISIFADAALVSSIIEGRSTFSEESVRYIYKKQLEEADILVLNKIDLISSDDVATLEEIVRTEYPGKIMLHQNSLDEHDIVRWIENIYAFAEAGQRNTLDVDYEIYGAGEAKLAWLDKTVTIIADDQNANFLAEQLISSIAHQIQSHRLPIGHLKFFIEANGTKQKISVTSTSRASDIKLADVRAAEATVLVNARVETDPQLLLEIVDHVLAQTESRYGCTVVNGKWSVFKPGFPRPTHRILA